MSQAVMDRLLSSPEPSVRWKVRVGVLGEDPALPTTLSLREEIRTSPRSLCLLSERDADGKIPLHPYAKWRGAHWVLAALADTGYPPGDLELIPLREQVLEWLFSERHKKHIRMINGRMRRCASQEGNALYALLSLGLADSRCDELAARLAKWQWPDGGWNCDKNPIASVSSFYESLIPLRALSLHARLTGSQPSQQAARRAAEIFLKRRLFRRLSDGRVIDPAFILLHYPPYWRYDILFALRVLADGGWIGDGRCREALDLLESQRLPDGGFPAASKYYGLSPSLRSGRSLVDWGGASLKRSNEFVTAGALCVLKSAGRLN